MIDDNVYKLQVVIVSTLRWLDPMFYSPYLLPFKMKYKDA